MTEKLTCDFGLPEAGKGLTSAFGPDSTSATKTPHEKRRKAKRRQKRQKSKHGKHAKETSHHNLEIRLQRVNSKFKRKRERENSFI